MVRSMIPKSIGRIGGCCKMYPFVPQIALALESLVELSRESDIGNPFLASTF